MPVDVKGRIVFNPDDKDQTYTLDCKQLGISEEGSGSLEDDIEDLRSRIEAAIVDEFHVSPKAIQLTGYTLSMNFSIEGPINRTLDQFATDTSKKDDT